MNSQPARALAGLCLGLAAWTVTRVPVMRQEFDAFVAATRGDTAATAALKPTSRSPTHREPALEPVVSPEAPIGVADAKPNLDVRHVPALRVPTLLDGASASSANMPLKASVVSADRVPIVSGRAAILPTASPSAAAAPAALAVTSPGTDRDPSATIAERAYVRLATGDRRGAADLLDTAIALGGDPRAAAWARDRDALYRRWSVTTYVIARDSGGGLAARPVLGGGQAGASLAYALDPLDRRPVALAARVTAPFDGGAIARAQAQAAFGATWRLSPGLTLAAERLVPLGWATRGAWTVRAASGVSGKRSGVDIAAYAEAGLADRATYAAAQARADVPLVLGSISLHSGAGAWASVQHDRRSVGRLDAGPGVRLRHRALPVELSADYRFRLAGNARPGSGLVVTVSTAF